jgi:dTDP-4-dehydrorhamnose reductase
MHFSESCLDLDRLINRLIYPILNEQASLKHMNVKKKNRVIITGSAGLLGQALLRRFRPDFHVIAIYNNTRPAAEYENLELYHADLAERAQVEKALLDMKPDFIVNSAAWVDVDGCETDRERAIRSNYTVAENLVRVSEEQGLYLLQISTDYIFNGRKHPARIDDVPDPLNFYGRTKLMAEEYIRKNHSNFLIARTCALVGAPRSGKTNLLNYFYDNLRAGKKVMAPNDIYANPIWIENLADLIAEAAVGRMSGVVHLGGADYMSRYNFALAFAEVFGFDQNLIVPVSADSQKRAATRPQYAGLDIERSPERFQTKILTIREALRGIRDLPP